ncbi:MAG: efflux RND transporter permease subunit [Planctomycetes bacterium]|nr:efflux RND transporter permease subunit [Planctomycetota bacterium]
MRGLARFSVENSVAVNLFACVLLCGGLFYYFALPREIFPDVSFDKVSVTTTWPGASPQDMERLVTLHIENAADALSGVKDLSSESSEGRSLVTAELHAGEDLERFVNDLRARVDALEELPEEVRTRYRPIVEEREGQFPVITLSLFGNAPEALMRDVAEEVKDDLLALDGVNAVGVSGVRTPEVWIEIEPRALEAHGLLPRDIARLVAAKNLQQPIATMPTPTGELLLRMDGEVRFARELLELPVLDDPLGRTLTLRDLGARVRDGFERPLTLGRYNGRPALTLAVTKDAEGDAIEIADAIRAYAADLQAGRRRVLPAGLSVGISSDFSVYIRNRLEVLETSGIWGLGIVLVVLCFFLDVRIALMTVLGLPVAILGAVLGCALLGITMNMITMFAFILVLGMLVDDAIVVVENVYRHAESGMPLREAVIQGVGEVGWPVVATVTTTMAAFLPLAFMAGTMGKFIAAIPVVVSLTLFFSLIEALVVMPAHLAEWTTVKVHVPGARRGGRRWYEALRRAYRRTLETCLRWRYVTLSASLGVLLLIGASAAAFLEVELLGEIESKIFLVDLETESSSTIESTRAAVDVLEAELLRLPDEDLASVTSAAGIAFLDANKFDLGTNLGQLTVELREGVARTRSNREVMDAVREQLAPFAAELEKLVVRQPPAGPGGPALEVEVRGPDPAVLEAISLEVAAFLAAQPGVRDLRSDLQLGKRELAIQLLDEGRRLGLAEAEVASQLRGALEGERASRLRRGRDDIDLLVRFPERYRARRETLREFRVKLPSGGYVPLERVAIVREERSPLRILRTERERTVTLSADVDRTRGNATDIAGRVERRFQGIEATHRGHRVELGGDKKEFEDSMRGVLPLAGVGLFLIYFILGALFRSYTQPFLVMAVIPFSLGAVLLGFLVSGEALSFLAVLGVVALSGVVVNDSLVLIDFVNQERRAGASLALALLRASTTRLRPILLTSLTTVGGLAPLAFFASGEAKFLAPMARAMVYGLTATTVLVLVIVPCLYLVREDLACALGYLRARWRRARSAQR